MFSAPQVAQVCNRNLKGNRTAFVVLRSVDGHRPVDLNGQAATRNPKLDGDKQSGKRGDHVGDRSNDKQQAKSRHFCSPSLSPSHARRMAPFARINITGTGHPLLELVSKPPLNQGACAMTTATLNESEKSLSYWLRDVHAMEMKPDHVPGGNHARHASANFTFASSRVAKKPCDGRCGATMAPVIAHSQG